MHVQHEIYSKLDDLHIIISLKLMGLYTNSWIYAMLPNMQAIVVGVVCLIGILSV